MTINILEDSHAVKPSILQQRESHFSWLRTRMSLERTLMSSVRTSSALIGFGFTIFQFFDRLNQMENVLPARNPGLAKIISLLLMAIGTFAMIIALIEYRTVLHYLWGKEFSNIAGMGDRPGWTPTSIVATLIALVGLTTFTVLVIRTAQH